MPQAASLTTIAQLSACSAGHSGRSARLLRKSHPERAQRGLFPSEVQMCRFPLAAVKGWVRRAARQPRVTRIDSCPHQGCHGWGHDQGKGRGWKSPRQGHGPGINSQQPAVPPQVSERRREPAMRRGSTQLRAAGLDGAEFRSWRKVSEAASPLLLILN